MTPDARIPWEATISETSATGALAMPPDQSHWLLPGMYAMVSLQGMAGVETAS
ncbi:MAG: hypothetical protein OXD36_08150 [Rhodobacter sp.]|nr:hypothetical protein [Rhodobacter sp.]MCY4241701.1 hypothetical protein [Rhodobacter sp.]